MGTPYRVRPGTEAINVIANSRVLLLFLAAFTIVACGDRSGLPATQAFPAAHSGQLEITYPLDETLFPPEIVAPTFTWEDATEGVEQWQVLLRLEDGSRDKNNQSPTALAKLTITNCSISGRTQTRQQERHLIRRLRLYHAIPGRRGYSPLFFNK